MKKSKVKSKSQKNKKQNNNIKNNIMYKMPIIAVITFSLFSCGEKKTEYDASGTFEAVETIVSAEASGTIKQLNIEEGQELTVGANVGYIDSLQLHLKRKQLQAQIK